MAETDSQHAADKALHELWLLQGWHTLSAVITALWITAILESLYGAMVLDRPDDVRPNRARAMVSRVASRLLAQDGLPQPVALTPASWLATGHQGD